MKITAFDELYSQNLTGGAVYIGGSSGSNSGFAGGDVVGEPGDLSVVGLRRNVALSSNLTGNIGDVLTIIATSPRTAQFATPSNTGSVGSNAMTRTGGGAAARTALGTVTTNQSLMIGGANYFTMTLGASIAVSFTGWPASGNYAQIGVRVTENGTGGYTPTFSGVTWLGGVTPTHPTTAGTSTEYEFWTDDGGSTVIGGQLGSASSGSALTVKDEGGSLDTAVTSLDFVGSGVTATNVGHAVTVTVASSVDAPTVSALGFVGPLLITDTPSTPLVFADLLQNEAQDDLMYADL